MKTKTPAKKVRVELMMSSNSNRYLSAEGLKVPFLPWIGSAPADLREFAAISSPNFPRIFIYEPTEEECVAKAGDTSSTKASQWKRLKKGDLLGMLEIDRYLIDTVIIASRRNGTGDTQGHGAQPDPTNIGYDQTISIDESKLPRNLQGKITVEPFMERRSDGCGPYSASWNEVRRFRFYTSGKAGKEPIIPYLYRIGRIE